MLYREETVCCEIHTKQINGLCGHNVEFWGAFAKLRKATVSFVISVRPSVHLYARNNSAPTSRIFMKFYIWGFVDKLSRKLEVSLKSDMNRGHFTWRSLYTFLIISRSVLLIMRNVPDKICRYIQNTYFIFNNLFSPPENRTVCERMWERFRRTGQATDGNMGHAHWVLDT